MCMMRDWRAAYVSCVSCQENADLSRDCFDAVLRGPVGRLQSGKGDPLPRMAGAISNLVMGDSVESSSVLPSNPCGLTWMR